MRYFTFRLFILCAALSVPAVVSQAQDAPKPAATAPKPGPTAEKPVQDAFDVMMEAIQDDDYPGFISVGEDTFQSGFKKSVFETVVETIGTRQKKGFQSSYLGKLKQSGYDVHLWKLTFNDGADDVLVKVAWSGGKVGGLFLG